MASDRFDTATLLERAKAHMTPNYEPPPLVMARGQGSTLWDLDGKAYLDFTTGIGVNALGHAHPQVTAAVTEQVARLSHVANLFYHPSYIALCQRLAELCFGSRVFLCNSGTEAVEAALKLARRYFHDRGENRTEYVATVGGFHGRTLGALSVTGQDKIRAGFGPFVPGVRLVPFADVEALRAAVGPATAAVIVEPIQGNGGIVVAPPGYLEAVRDVCSAAGCLFILDEVQTGIGRTGAWFFHQHEKVTPDVMTLAKALGGGLPLGAMVTTDEIAGCLTVGAHGSTFGGNPVACAAGLATMDVIAREGLVERARRMGDKLIAMLRDLATRTPCVREVRGRGLMVGMVLSDQAKPVQTACREAGLLVTTAGPNVLRLLPPLIVTDQEIERAVDIIAKAPLDRQVA